MLAYYRYNFRSTGRVGGSGDDDPLGDLPYDLRSKIDCAIGAAILRRVPIFVKACENQVCTCAGRLVGTRLRAVGVPQRAISAEGPNRSGVFLGTFSENRTTPPPPPQQTSPLPQVYSLAVDGSLYRCGCMPLCNSKRELVHGGPYPKGHIRMCLGTMGCASTGLWSPPQSTEHQLLFGVMIVTQPPPPPRAPSISVG